MTTKLRARWARSPAVPALTIAAMLIAAACADDDGETRDDERAPKAGNAANAGASGSAAGGSTPSAGTTGMAGRAAGGNAPNSNSGGSAGRDMGGAPGAAGESDGDTAGAGPDAGGQTGNSPGQSPYARECHGDSLDCDDPDLRCLGLREADRVFGYSCSNPCDDDDGCSTASSGASATAACVQFVTTKHCLLVCNDPRNGERQCPTGMSCYTYPGAEIGYCLWP